MAKDNKTYAVGDELAGGVVTGVGTNNGSPEYTVAFQDENSERPVDIGPRVHPAAFTNGPVELAEENQKTYDAVAKQAEEADKALEEKNKEEGAVDGNDSPEEIREKTVTPDPTKTPAGNASAAKPATTTKTATK